MPALTARRGPEPISKHTRHHQVVRNLCPYSTFFKDPLRWPLSPNQTPACTPALSPTLTLLDGIDLQGF